jgi:glycosyltransferase involved in cell wall biosynthesis
MAAPGKPPKILYFATDDGYFCRTRLPLARAARQAGADVVVVTGVSRHSAAIEAAGLRLIALPIRRGGVNPWQEARTLLALARLYRRERPDLIHHIALKSVLHGCAAARFLRPVPIVNTFTGLGTAFIGSTPAARRIGRLVRLALRPLLRRNTWTVAQNPDDRALLVREHLAAPDRAVVILGDGTDVARFAPTPEPPVAPDAPLTAVYAGRMLADKGVAELVEAARRLRVRAVPVRIRLAGAPDVENPTAVSEATLRAWQREGVIDWLGHVEDMPGLWAQCHIAVLPSYREGLPNALVEAGACCRALIATDVPGCREVVRHEQTGLLVPPRDPAALAEAIQRLAEDGALRRRLGAAARARAEAEYAEPVIIAQTLRLYGSLLGWAAAGDSQPSQARSAAEPAPHHGG